MYAVQVVKELPGSDSRWSSPRVTRRVGADFLHLLLYADDLHREKTVCPEVREPDVYRRVRSHSFEWTVRSKLLPTDCVVLPFYLRGERCCQARIVEEEPRA
jgi:hypothetical protein